MGASSWSYSVPFRPDIEAALQDLRQEVYDRGEYYAIEPNPDLLLPLEEFVARYRSDSGDGILEFMLEEREKFLELAPPTDPDSRFAWQGGEGTHSIIDMACGVSPEPELFAVSPMTDEELVSELGTTRPRTPAVRALLAEGWVGLRDRWYGSYLISYREDDTPDEIHFFGFSGD